MKELLTEIQSSVMMEYTRAADKFGKANNSNHESYAIILEELEEAKDEQAEFSVVFNIYWADVKCNQNTPKRLKELQNIAEHAAAEWVQVAAMCHKAAVKL